MITKYQESIQSQQTSTLLQLLTRKQQSVTNALLSKNKSAEQTVEIQQFIDAMKKLQQIQQKNIDKALSKIQKIGFYEYIKVLFSSRFQLYRIIYCQIKSIQQFVNGLFTILLNKSYSDCAKMLKWQKLIYYQQLQRLVKSSILKTKNEDYQQSEQFKKYIEKETPKLIKKLNSMIGLLIQQFQSYKQNNSVNSSLKNFMAQLIHIIKRSIQRSVIKEQQLSQIAGCQIIKNHIFDYCQISNKQFDGWQRSSKKLQILQECIDYAIALSNKKIEITIEYLPNQKITILKQIFSKHTKITFLSLKQCQLGRQKLDFLKQLIHVKYLLLSDNHIDDDGMNKITQIKFDQIKQLSMDSNPITNKGLYYLAKAYWSQINTISMIGCPITTSGLKVIVKLTHFSYFNFFKGELLENKKSCVKFYNSFRKKYFLSLTIRKL